MSILDMLNRLTTIRALMIGMMVGAVYYFIMFDSGESYSAQANGLQVQVNELKKKINDSDAKIQTAMVYKQAAAELGTKIDQMMSVIPEKFDETDLLALVSREIEAAGSSLLNIAAVPPTPQVMAPEFEEIRVKLNVDGSFSQHMMFLANLTKINQIVVAKELEFSLESTPAPGVPPLVKLVATIVAYRYKGKMEGQ